MKKRPAITVFLFTLLSLPALGQGLWESCTVTVTGQNRNRLVNGAVNMECGAGLHSAPFGNWGVRSNYGSVKDTDQFRGWKWLDGPTTKRQWNSCTTRVDQYRAPDPRYYTYPGFRDQRSNDTVTHGTYTYRARRRNCRLPVPTNTDCSGMDGYRVNGGTNYMDIYELDWPDSDDFITRLSYRFTSVEFQDCTRNGCPERRTAWQDQYFSRVSSSGVSAQMRMTASATFKSYCRGRR